MSSSIFSLCQHTPETHIISNILIHEKKSLSDLTKIVARNIRFLELILMSIPVLFQGF